MSIRDRLIEELRAVVGPDDKVHIVGFQDNLDVLDRPTIMLKQLSIAPLPEAPTGGLRIEFVLTFIAPELDPTPAETYLDTWVPATLADLRMPWFAWTEATKVAYEPLSIAYDVRAFVIATPTNEGAAS